MRRRMLAIAFLTATLTPAIVWAGSSSSITSWSIRLSAQETSYTTGAGPCTGGEGLANYCPVGPCDCAISTGTASGSVGQGSVTVYETIDKGKDFGVAGDCSPAYFDVEITDATQDNESIAGSGGDCYDGGFRIVNEYVGGGCELGAASKLFLNANGQCSGFYGEIDKSDTYPLKFLITGTAIKN